MFGAEKGFPTKMITDIVFKDDEDIEEILRFHVKSATLVCYIHNSSLDKFITRLEEELKRTTLRDDLRFEEQIETKTLIVTYRHIAYIDNVEIHRAEGIIMIGDDVWTFVIQAISKVRCFRGEPLC
jgi:hypothetical protein